MNEMRGYEDISKRCVAQKATKVDTHKPILISSLSSCPNLVRARNEKGSDFVQIMRIQIMQDLMDRKARAEERERKI